MRLQVDSLAASPTCAIRAALTFVERVCPFRDAEGNFAGMAAAQGDVRA